MAPSYHPSYKKIAIVFGIILLLVILISALGGSVRFLEHFDASPPPSMKTMPVKPPPSQMVKPHLSKKSSTTKKEGFAEEDEERNEAYVEAFDGGMYAGFTDEEGETA